VNDNTGGGEAKRRSKYTVEPQQQGGALSQAEMRQEVLNILKLLRSKKMQVLDPACAAPSPPPTPLVRRLAGHAPRPL
jgi:hypothetical protein